MRILIIFDIHSNCNGLNTALADFAHEQVDQVVYPREVQVSLAPRVDRFCQVGADRDFDVFIKLYKPSAIDREGAVTGLQSLDNE